jgi:bisphosphoglycerate-independent phosphoglycerate mutase (AlkP superfamily)
MDPDAVPGILLLNRAVRRELAQIIDLAPTILNYLGVPAPATMEGTPLL